MKFSHSKTHNDTVHTIAGGGTETKDRMGYGADDTYGDLAFHLPSLPSPSAPASVVHKLYLDSACVSHSSRRAATGPFLRLFVPCVSS